MPPAPPPPRIDVMNPEPPPLGRHWDFIAEDIGTVGEAAAAHKMIEEAGGTILMDPAHGYGPYRTWFMEWVAEHDGPLGPTLHGGSIPFDIGGGAPGARFPAQGPGEGGGGQPAVIVEAGSLESPAVIREAAEAGLSTNWIGETGWSQAEFLQTLGLETIDTQESVGYIALGYRDANPARELYT